MGNGELEDQAQPGGPPTTRTDVGLEDRKGRGRRGKGGRPRGGAKPSHPNNKTRQGNKQMPKATSEEVNKSKQTLGQKKQKPIGNRNTTENNWLLHNSMNKTIIEQSAQ